MAKLPLPKHKTHKQPKHVPTKKFPAVSNQRNSTVTPCHPSTTVPPFSCSTSIPAVQHGQTVPTSTTVPTPPRPKTPTLQSKAIMSTSLTPEQVAEQALREKAEVEAQLKYVQRQLGQLMEEKKRGLWNSKSSSKHRDSDDSEGSNPMSDSSEDEFEQRSRRHQRPRERGYGDFKVDIPEFKGQLDPDIFLDWLQTVERVFEYKDIPEGKKVKLVALKLRKYASIWWSNVVSKRVRKGKNKIKTWEQMKSKLKAKFLPPHYLQDNFLKLHHLKQGSKSVEEYTRDFEQLLLKCDLREDDSQTLIRYLSGLEEQIAHVVELHPYTSLDELSALAHKVEKQKKLKGKKYPMAYPPKGPFNIKSICFFVPHSQIDRPTA